MDRLEELLEKGGLAAFKKQCYAFASHFEYASILDSCEMDERGDYEFLAAFGAEEVISSFHYMSKLDEDAKWWFGCLSYDLKNRLEALESTNESGMDCPELTFFTPTYLIGIKKHSPSNSGSSELIKMGEIPDHFFNAKLEGGSHQLERLNESISKNEYLHKIHEIHDLIRQGEVYELNFCVNHDFSYSHFHPELFQWNLVNLSPVPMAAFFRSKTHVLCSGSMERFLRREGTTLKSEPIKGTIARGKTDEEDQLNRRRLETSEKDRAENVMIVDLVRNDLNRICKTGSVKAEPLFQVESFAKVHQMISYVRGTIVGEVSFKDVMRALFPMGSMTGTPKISAMKQIDKLENFKREWYSGTVGYIQPNKDFDFNVIIRSLVSNTETQRIRYCAGGAITIDSVPEDEWDEMRLKTRAIEEVLDYRS